MAIAYGEMKRGYVSPRTESSIGPFNRAFESGRRIVTGVTRAISTVAHSLREHRIFMTQTSSEEGSEDSRQKRIDELLEQSDQAAEAFATASSELFYNPQLAKEAAEIASTTQAEAARLREEQMNE